jgi:SAM-dependent methyltransferase
MPYSSTEGKEWMREQIDRLAPATVLDVGAGAGTYFDLAAQPWQFWMAVEVWQPYLARFDLAARYDGVIFGDVRTIAWPDIDLVIFGDVLEHLSRADALMVWDDARKHSRHVLLSIPVVPYPQGAEEGNPHEAHLETWAHEECEALPGVIAHQLNPTIGCYVAGGLR